MCGIFGFWLNRPLNDDDLTLGRRATAALAHRGPDGNGEWVDAAQGLYFGHRRLAIVDLSDASAQPMRRDDLVVTFNGEIYNFAELRDELSARGEAFTTSGDTEVLLSVWKTWGRDGLDRLDGMFAFALFDGHELHLAVDPFGEKPLFVARTAEGVFFASEAQVLIRALGLSFVPTAEDTARFLALGFLPPPATGFPGLSCLPPAALYRFDAPDREPEIRRTWTPPRARPGEGKSRVGETDLDDLGAILVRLLRRRIRADVPVGLFLSSGIDSALAGALVSRELGVALNSLTVSFPDGADEALAAAEIAARLGLPHRIVDSRGDESWRDMPGTLAAFYGVPNDNSTALSVFQMSRLARQGMTVAVSGCGGDEAFFGYNKYTFLYGHRRLYRLPRALLSLLHPVRGVFGRRWKLAERLLGGTAPARFLALKNGEIGELMRLGLFAAPSLPGFDAAGRDLYCAARDFDVTETLPASYIPSIDRGSMRASVEVRTPYLARELFAFVAQFQSDALVAGGQKIVLRRLLQRYLPADLIDRPKRGFVFPLKRYLDTLDGTYPAIPGLNPAAAAHVWQRRDQNDAGPIALRMKVLEAFHNPSPAS